MQIPVLKICMNDEVVIYPLIAGQDDSGGPTDTYGTGITRPCGVQDTAGTSLAGHRVERFGSVAGEADFNLVFADGSNLPTGADWRIEWTRHNGVSLPTPVVMTALAAATPPGGLKSRWTVACKRVS